jgi:ribosomal protein S18 acetylase RimI-like enzyme
MDIIIIKADSRDAVEILALQKKAYLREAELNGDFSIPPMTQTLSDIESEFHKKIFLKAVHDDKIIGSVRGHLDQGSYYIGRLIVDPGWQGRGIGSMLMEGIEKAFPDAERFELFTGKRSIANIRLYERLGYEKFREDDLNQKVRLVFLWKNQMRKNIEKSCSTIHWHTG